MQVGHRNLSHYIVFMHEDQGEQHISPPCLIHWHVNSLSIKWQTTHSGGAPCCWYWLMWCIGGISLVQAVIHSWIHSRMQWLERKAWGMGLWQHLKECLHHHSLHQYPISRTHDDIACPLVTNSLVCVLSMNIVQKITDTNV
jgi:hypothetical protein